MLILIQIVNSGDNYNIKIKLHFDNTDTKGRGVSVSVDSVIGKNITSNINTTIIF